MSFLPAQHVLEPALRAQLGAVQRWFSTLAHAPAAAAVLGALPLCAAPPVYDASKYQQHAKKVRPAPRAPRAAAPHDARML